MAYETDQEAFWAGDFGDEYIGRNSDDRMLGSLLGFFTNALRSAQPPATCIEFGANVGMNLRALRLLYPDLDQHAIEINAEAAQTLRSFLPADNVHATSILDFAPQRTWDLALIKGVLIHIDPARLPQVYDTLHQATNRYLLLGEYYNPSPVAISYRGHDERLFKRDFCGEILDRHADLELVDYGFAYHRDPKFPQGDITWFLLEKRPA
ncbi:MAG: spore coat polysaccharide biosynthesis protein SpsF [Baekduia sp.]|jgi:pseudaminic acid biosynthesis-associated methylase|nr:spore coat polysaccharide biosynthesis protein SpsF [Baekduia sp.]